MKSDHLTIWIHPQIFEIDIFFSQSEVAFSQLLMLIGSFKKMFQMYHTILWQLGLMYLWMKMSVCNKKCCFWCTFHSIWLCPQNENFCLLLDLHWDSMVIKQIWFSQPVLIVFLILLLHLQNMHSIKSLCNSGP